MLKLLSGPVANRASGRGWGHLPSREQVRPEIRGKFLFVGSEKFFVKGVSYGAFKPDENKREYQDRAKLDNDFGMMATNGINTVRIPHTAPPPHLLDLAQKHNLR